MTIEQTKAVKLKPAVSRLLGALSGLITIVVVLAISGCGKSDQNAAAGSAAIPPVEVTPDPVDLTEVKKAFASASPALQIYLDETTSLIRARLFSDAIEQSQKLLKNPNLNSEQKTAVQNLMEKVKVLASGRTP